MAHSVQGVTQGGMRKDTDHPLQKVWQFLPSPKGYRLANGAVVKLDQGAALTAPQPTHSSLHPPQCHVHSPVACEQPFKRTPTL